VLTLIVNADDFGLAEGINRSIAACHDAGSVSSATLLVNMNGTEQAAAYARERPALGVGLHFNLTQGRPLSLPRQIPSLVSRDGTFHRRRDILTRSVLGRLRKQDVARELEAQLERCRTLGLKVTHVDSHQHVHALVPAIFDVVATVAAGLNLPVRVPWKWRGSPENRSMRREVKQLILAGRLRRSTRRIDVRTNDHFCSVFDLALPPEKLPEDSYARLLEPYEGGIVELMVHPAIVDDEVRSLTGIAGYAHVENRLLQNAVLGKWIEKRRAQLRNYHDVKLQPDHSLPMNRADDEIR
jgi:chitin disaccharide deacetylase